MYIAYLNCDHQVIANKRVQEMSMITCHSCRQDRIVVYVRESARAPIYNEKEEKEKENDCAPICP